MIRNIVFDIGGVLIRFMPGEAMRKLAIPEEKSLRFLRLRFIVNGGRNWIVDFLKKRKS